MKKTISGILVLVMILSVLFTFPVSAEESEFENVALGCTYTGSAPYTTGWETNPGYREIDGKELTDGVKGSAPGGTEWYALYKEDNFELTVDLGSVVSGIVRLNAEFEDKEDWGIGLPASVAYYGSTDNKTWTMLGAGTDVTKSGMCRNYTLELTSGGSYRYIRLAIERGAKIFCFISEIEVFAGYVSNVDFGVGSTAFIEESTIRGVNAKTDFETFMNQLNTRDGVTLTDAKGKAKTSGNIANGDVLNKAQQDGSTVSYTIIVDGDTNGDGNVDAFDYLLLKTHVLGTYHLENAALIAADCNLSGGVDAFDYQMVKAHVLGTFNIFKKYPEKEAPKPPAPPAPTDGRGDVTEEFKDMDTTDKIETLTSWDMTLTHTSDTVYTITSVIDDATMTLTFHKRNWGTFNLGAWSVKDAAGTHRFTTGSTDMEYVYRVRKDDATGWVWSGGNHSNEKMTELKFYDGISGKELNLAVGQSANIKNLRVVEKTKLYNDPAGDDGKYNYDEKYFYATAVREYTFVGPQIRLAVDYSYVKDTYYQKSYTCMMPIEKPYGLYCAGYGKDDKLAFVYETTKKGIKPDYSGTTWQGKEAVRCTIFGYDQYAPYKIDVRVLTPDTSISNNKSKLMFWDMNSGSNKLYYSKYEDGSYTKEAAGTTVHTECQWTYYKD